MKQDSHDPVEPGFTRPQHASKSTATAFCLTLLLFSLIGMIARTATSHAAPADATPSAWPVASPADTPVAIPTDPPVPTPADTPAVIPTDPPMPTPADTPVAIPTDPPVPTSVDTPAPIPTDIPMPTRAHTHKPPRTENPVVIPTDPPVPTPVDTPVPPPAAIPVDTPVPTPTPTNTLAPAIVSTPGPHSTPQPAVTTPPTEAPTPMRIATPQGTVATTPTVSADQKPVSLAQQPSATVNRHGHPTSTERSQKNRLPFSALALGLLASLGAGIALTTGLLFLRKSLYGMTLFNRKLPPSGALSWQRVRPISMDANAILDGDSMQAAPTLNAFPMSTSELDAPSDLAFSDCSFMHTASDTDSTRSRLFSFSEGVPSIMSQLTLIQAPHWLSLLRRPSDVPQTCLRPALKPIRLMTMKDNALLQASMSDSTTPTMQDTEPQLMSMAWWEKELGENSNERMLL